MNNESEVLKMSILVFEPRTPRRLEEMYSYLSDSAKTSWDGMFGIGVTVGEAVTQMRFIQNLYKFENLLHEYFQVIFCFDVGVMVNLGFLRGVCERIGRVLITDERQVFGAIHYLDKPDKIHCHYIINFVGIDGALYRQKFSLQHYRQRVNAILMEYSLSLIRSH